MVEREKMKEQGKRRNRRMTDKERENNEGREREMKKRE